MTKRILESQIVYTGDLHVDLLPTTFSHLNPANLLIAELVCTTWKKASLSHNKLWECVAYRKGIFVDRSADIRIQVIQSFRPYCEAARKIFCNELAHIPKDKSPITEKLMIDQAISQMDKTKINPLNLLLENLSIRPFETWQTGFMKIEDSLKLMHVLAETGTLTINEDLLTNLFEHARWCRYYNKGLIAFLTDIETYTTLFFNGESHYDRSSKKIPLCQEVNKALFSIIEYILYFTEKPSLNLIDDLCHTTATIQLCFAWHEIGFTYFSNRNLLNSQLENLKGSDWEEAFAKFMQENNAPVSIEIQYPPFLKDILQKLDKTEVQELIKLLPASIEQSNNPYTNFMHKQIQKNREQFFHDLNKSLSETQAL